MVQSIRIDFGFQRYGHQQYTIQLPHQHPSSRIAQRVAAYCGFVCSGVAHATGVHQNQVVHTAFWELTRTAFYANPHHEYQDVTPLEKEALPT